MPSDRPRRLTLDAIFRTKALDDKVLRAPKWMADNRRLAYLDEYPGSKLSTIWTYDSKTRLRTPLLDPRSLVYRKAGKRKRLGIHTITLSKNERYLLLTAEAPARFKPCGDLFVYDLEGASLRRLTRSGKPQFHPAFSPDGTMAGFVRDNDLWIVETATGKERRLTRDGSETLYNGRCGWVYEEELGLARSWEWSPDGRTIAFLQQDETAVPELLLSQYDQPHAEPRRTRYPKAGDPNPTVRLGFLGLGDKPLEPAWADLSGCVPTEEHYIAHLQWTPDGSGLLVQYIPRLQNRLILMRVDPSTGGASTIIEETDERWVDHPGKLHFIGETDRFLWPSERDGWRRIYLYGLDGTCHGPITPAECDVEGVAAVDARAGRAYVIAAMPGPTERHILRVPLNGGDAARITKGSDGEDAVPPAGWSPSSVTHRSDGEDAVPPGWTLNGGHAARITNGPGRHGAMFNKDASLYLHTHSALNMPQTIVLRTASGDIVDALIADGSPNLARYGVQRGPTPTFDPARPASGEGWQLLTFRTDDGETLHGRILLPKPFDPSRRYPALMHTYGGPGSQVALNAWGGKSALWYHYLAERGCVIFLCDNRGTGSRGSAFKKITYLKLGEWEVRDQIAGARFLGSLPFVDESRIAIWGWSYGGYMASSLILKGADVFRAAIAVAPVTDWKLYDTIYTERYMRRPSDNEKGYHEGSPVHFAKQLKGRFLLIHGTMDDNVHFQNAARLASALQDKGKQFETMFYPGKRHGIEGRHLHLYRLMTDFLRRAL